MLALLREGTRRRAAGGRGWYQGEFEEDFPYSEFVESFDVAVVSQEYIQGSIFT